MDLIELRRAPRTAHDSVMELCDKDGVLTGEAVRLLDVSALGVGFASVKPFREGSRIRARMRLFGQGVFQLSGRVVWIRGKGNVHLHGVECESFSPFAPARR